MSKDDAVDILQYIKREIEKLDHGKAGDDVHSNMLGGHGGSVPPYPQQQRNLADTYPGQVAGHNSNGRAANGKKGFAIEGGTVRLATLVTVLGLVISVAYQVAVFQTRFELQQDKIIEDLAVLGGSLKALDQRANTRSPEDWKRRDMAEFCQAAARVNRNFKCPDPYSLAGFKSRSRSFRVEEIRRSMPNR